LFTFAGFIFEGQETKELIILAVDTNSEQNE